MTLCFVMRITPARISTPPVPVSGFVTTTTTPARIPTLPFTVSGIEQYTRRLLNIVLLKNYKIIIYITGLKRQKNLFQKITVTIYKNV